MPPRATKSPQRYEGPTRAQKALKTALRASDGTGLPEAGEGSGRMGENRESLRKAPKCPGERRKAPGSIFAHLRPKSRPEGQIGAQKRRARPLARMLRPGPGAPDASPGARRRPRGRQRPGGGPEGSRRTRGAKKAPRGAPRGMEKARRGGRALKVLMIPEDEHDGKQDAKREERGAEPEGQHSAPAISRRASWISLHAR